MNREALWNGVFSAGTWIINNSLTLAQVLAALVTAMATIALWRVTQVLAKETTTLAKMTARPFVVCWLESSTASSIALNLTLRNTGNATAFDIKMCLTPALPKSPNDTISDDGAQTVFETSLLPPGQMLSIQGAMGPKVHDLVFTVNLSWSKYPGSTERETLKYSFEPKDGFRGGFNSRSIHDVAQELEKIRKHLSSRGSHNER